MGTRQNNIPDQESPIRVLIVDDHPALRLGLRALLEKAPDIRVVGEAGSGGKALDLAQRLAPDVVLMDINLPDVSGFETTQKIVSELPGARVLMFSNFSDDQNVYHAIQAGAIGFLLKSDSTDLVVDAIREAHQGIPSLSKKAEIGLLTQIHKKRDDGDPLSALTPQEKVVLGMLAEGITDGAMAERLVVSPGTIRTHISNIMRKLHLENRAQAVIFSLQNK